MQDPRRNVMRSVKIDKHKLLDIVRENKVKHITEFEEAIIDYKAAALKVANEHLELANTGDLDKIAQIKAMPSRPKSYEDSYARAVRMLELSVDEIIELEETIFNQLVLDEWTWKMSFTASNSLYKTM